MTKNDEIINLIICKMISSDNNKNNLNSFIFVIGYKRLICKFAHETIQQWVFLLLITSILLLKQTFLIFKLLNWQKYSQLKLIIYDLINEYFMFIFNWILVQIS